MLIYKLKVNSQFWLQLKLIIDEVSKRMIIEDEK